MSYFDTCGRYRTAAVVGRAIVFLCLISVGAWAQTADPDGGSPSFITSVQGQFDQLDFPSGNLLLKFPIRSKTGKYPLSYKLVGNSHAYIAAPPNGNFNGRWAVSSGIGWWLKGTASGSNFSANVGIHATSDGANIGQCGAVPNDLEYRNWYVLDENGTKHTFPANVLIDRGGCDPTTVTGTTIDSSGYTVKLHMVNPGAGAQLQVTLWDKSGNVLMQPNQPPSCNGSIYCTTDPDGISAYGSPGVGPIVDTLGQTFMNATVTGGATGDKYQYADFGGSNQNVQVNYVQNNSVTSFGVPTIAEAGVATGWLPSNIVYPDGETIAITYEKMPLPAWQASHLYNGLSAVAVVDSNGNLEGVMTAGTSGGAQPVWNGTVGGQTNDGTVVWKNYGNNWTNGRVASVTYPQGGSVSYAYSGMNVIANTNGSVAWPAQITRTVNDNAGNSSTWTYQISAASSNHGSVVVTETDPASNVTVTKFVGATPTGVSTTCKNSYSSLCLYSYIPVEKLFYSGAAVPSNLIGMHVTCYNGLNSSENGCINPTVPLYFPITRTDEYSHPIAPGGTATPPSNLETLYDAYGNVTAVKRFDLGASFPPTTPMSTSTIVYNSGSTCGTLSVSAMRDRICSVTVAGSTGTIAQTKYTYNAAGHPVQTSKLVSGTNFLTSSAAYNTNGTLASTTDANGAVMTYAYNGVGGCNNLLLTSTASSVNSLSTAQTWNCSGGVVTSTIDSNSQTTFYGYQDQGGVADPMWRLRSKTDALNNTTRYNFNTATLPFTSESVLTFNSGSSTSDNLTTYDGLGRPAILQRKQSPTSSNYDTISQTYDLLGRISNISMPCSMTASVPCSTAPATTITYDALGRKLLVTDGGGGTVSYTYVANDTMITRGPAPSGENVKSRQLEYDGIGRVKSVCEITNGAGSGTCSQSTSRVGYWTKYTYDVLNNLTGVSQNAQTGAVQQTRSFSYDGLSRLISETNPESGTQQYFYDSSPATPGYACGLTSAGDLTKSYDARGDTQCFAYDGLHRLVQNFDAGPNTQNISRYFIYDTATVNGVNMSNSRGLLAEAFTATCLTCTKLTDLGFKHSALGETLETYQSTPNSGGYYHPTATYWPNGEINSLWIAQIPSVAYGVDGEGRVSSVTPTAGQVLVTGTSYNPANQLTSVTYGSGDHDDFAFDPNASRMTQYKFSMGTTPLIKKGDLTWNGNGTLRVQQITDQIVAANSQTCTYTYDDLGRLAGRDASSQSVNCPGKWTQAFTLDPFGNLSKSGTSSFVAGYVLINGSTNNRIQSITGVSGPTYDASGNLLTITDGLSHSYVWDGYGSPINIDSVSLTYDALGRVVEQSRASVATQIVYSPIGGKFTLMNGTALSKAFLPLPGGGTAVYNLSGLQYYRHSDLLGSSRIASTPSRTKYFDVEFAPYGENYGNSGTSDLSFTGQNQDTVAGLYDFMYREYSSIAGRWISPDPAGITVASAENPQSWNQYAYVMNNPLINIDPTGLYCDYSDHDDPQSGFDYSQFDFHSNLDECTDHGGQWVDDAYTKNGADIAGRPEEAVSSIGAPTGPWGMAEFQAYGQQWVLGELPTQLNYGPNDFETLAMINRPYVQAQLAAYVQAGCPANQRDAGQDSVTAYRETAGDALSGHPNYVQAEVGGYSGTISTSGGATTVTLTNVSGVSSFVGYSAAVGEVNKHLGTHFNRNKLDRNHGFGRNVTQTFVWTEPSPCK